MLMPLGTKPLIKIKSTLLKLILIKTALRLIIIDTTNDKNCTTLIFSGLTFP